VASAWAESPDGPLVEAIEAPGERWVVGVQFHPERTDSTPAAYEALWREFVDACRAGAGD
jgi:putative glutamine amidotransferase